MLDPLMQRLGAESVLLSVALLGLGPSLIAALLLSTSQKKNVSDAPVIENKIKLYGIIVLVASTVLLGAKFRLQYNSNKTRRKQRIALSVIKTFRI